MKEADKSHPLGPALAGDYARPHHLPSFSMCWTGQTYDKSVHRSDDNKLLPLQSRRSAFRTNEVYRAISFFFLKFL